MSNWKEKELGTLCSIQLGKTPARANNKLWDTEKVSQNVWLSIADLKHGSEISDSKEFISDTAAESIKIVPKGTLMVSFKLSLGRTSFAGKDLYTNEAIASLINLSEEIDKNYLNYYFTYFDWDKASESDIKVKGKTLNKAKLSKLPILYPSLSKQKRIVSKLDQAFEAIDQAIANTEKNIENVEELEKSWFQEQFREGQADWIDSTIGDIGKVSMCKRILKKQTTVEGDIPFYKIGTFGKSPDAFITQKLFSEYVEKYSYPKKGDILISASGTIGRRVRFDGRPSYFQDSNIVWIANDEQRVLNDFLYEFYGNCNWNPTSGATIKRLYNDDLRKIKISYPKSLSQQLSLVESMQNFRYKIESITSSYQLKLIELKELKMSILEQAFKGELV